MPKEWGHCTWKWFPSYHQFFFSSLSCNNMNPLTPTVRPFIYKHKIAAVWSVFALHIVEKDFATKNDTKHWEHQSILVRSVCLRSIKVYILNCGIFDIWCWPPWTLFYRQFSTFFLLWMLPLENPGNGKLTGGYFVTSKSDLVMFSQFPREFTQLVL